MRSVNSQLPIDRIAEILDSIRKRGIKLWLENGQLHYRALKGELTQEEIEILRISRGQIVAILEEVSAEVVESEIERRPCLDRAPLAFSQLARWHSHRLGQRRSSRVVASATRLRGHLNIDALRKSVVEIVRRHDSLRTRISVFDGVPTQEIAESVECELKVDDLTALSESFREAEVKRRFEEHMFEPIDIAVDPLFAVRLLRLRNDEHVFIVAMDHMIADGVSRNILLRDIFAAYTQILRDNSFSFPALPIQFADYAVRQRSAQKHWMEKHGEYWNEHLSGCQRVHFPVDENIPTASHLGAGLVPCQIGRDLKMELREWCRLRRTTLVMGVFTAYVGLVLRWCNVSEAVILYQTDGRFSPEMQNMIGNIAFRLYLRIELHEDDSFVDLMNRVIEEYCKAHEHADSSYMEAQLPRPEFTRNSCFNWLRLDPKSDDFTLGESEGTIACSRVPFEKKILENFDMDAEPMIGLLETDDEIRGWVHFPLNRFSVGAMESFGRNFLVFIRALLERPEERVKDIVLI